MLFPWLYPGRNGDSTKSEKLILESRTGLDNSYSWLMVGLRRIRLGASMH
jgi:hypothetical protein